MAQTIARMYANQESAAAALAALRDRGFRADATHIIARPEMQDGTSPDADASSDPVLAAMTKIAVAPEHAGIYAERVRRGEALVAVEAQFGTAQLATTVLEGANPVSVTLPEVEYSSGVNWASAAPLSSALGIPVLLSDATPLSNFLKWPSLKRESASSASLAGIQRQSREAAPLSRSLKLPLLSDNAAPLSGTLKLPVLLEKAAPLSDALKWKAMFNDPAPLSEKTKLPVLSDNPAPLSTSLGLALLSNNPAPLSSLLKLPVLSKKQR